MSQETDSPSLVHAVRVLSPVSGHDQPALARPEGPLAIIARASAQLMPPISRFVAVNGPSGPLVAKAPQSPPLAGAGDAEPPPGMFHDTDWEPRVQDV